jgi:hypothetical protein
VSDDPARLSRTEREVADPLLLSEVLADTQIANAWFSTDGSPCPTDDHHRRLRLTNHAVARASEEI